MYLYINFEVSSVFKILKKIQITKQFFFLKIISKDDVVFMIYFDDKMLFVSKVMYQYIAIYYQYPSVIIQQRFRINIDLYP